jgi:hypothetical protein
VHGHGISERKASKQRKQSRKTSKELFGYMMQE